MAVTQGKPIDAAYLLDQLKAFNSKILAETYNVKFQFTTMPAASATYAGQYVQYIGNTTIDYTTGYFYKCVVDIDTAAYKWVAVTQNSANYEIKKLGTPEEGYTATYQLEKDGVKVGDSINIPKDYFVTDATVSKVTEEDKQAGGKFADDDDFSVGDAYIDLTINVYNPVAGNEKHIYINVSTLVDTYTAGDGIAIDSNKISVALHSSEQGLELKTDGTDKKLALVFESTNIDFENDWN